MTFVPRVRIHTPTVDKLSNDRKVTVLTGPTADSDTVAWVKGVTIRRQCCHELV
jgi:hypothetical protein